METGCYKRQIAFQEKLTNKKLPDDLPLEFRDQICLMAEELGEVAKTDKRWRAGQTETVQEGTKLEEIADIFIVAMNLAIFSGYDYLDVMNAVQQKITKNEGRLPK